MSEVTDNFKREGTGGSPETARKWSRCISNIAPEARMTRVKLRKIGQLIIIFRKNQGRHNYINIIVTDNVGLGLI
jgi:hypothetical protein